MNSKKVMGAGRNTLAKGSMLDKGIGKPDAYPKGSSNNTGSRGGQAQGSANGGTAHVLGKSAAMGQPGSGHTVLSAKRKTTSGYTTPGKAPKVMPSGGKGTKTY